MASPPVIWKKRILIPFWVVRIALMLFLIVIYAIALKVIHDSPDRTMPRMGVVILFMLLIVAVLLMDVMAIVLFLRDSLNAKTFLFINSFQTGFWGVVLILDVVAIARGASAVGIAFTIFVFFTFVVLLIYAVVGYSRQRKQAQRGNYAPAHNPAAPGVQPPSYHVPPPYQQQNTSYYSMGTPAELHNQPAPAYHGGAAADFYASQPVKPAQMV